MPSRDTRRETLGALRLPVSVKGSGDRNDKAAVLFATSAERQSSENRLIVARANI
jgi:CO dehydrogenase/acetyl-CoA synthase delta subunit